MSLLPAYPLERVVTWDRLWCIRLNRMSQWSTLRLVLWVASSLGNGLFWYCLMLALLLRYGVEAAPAVMHMIGVGLVCTALYKALKGYTSRPRPYQSHSDILLAAAPLDRFSFPSGHTLHAVGFSMVALSYYPGLAAVLLPFTMLVAISRPALGLHYPSDVIAGALIGAAVAGTSLCL